MALGMDFFIIFLDISLEEGDSYEGAAFGGDLRALPRPISPPPPRALVSQRRRRQVDKAPLIVITSPTHAATPYPCACNMADPHLLAVQEIGQGLAPVFPVEMIRRGLQCAP